MPSPTTVAKALELIGKGGVDHSYFFSQLKSPEWIGPLAEAGFFRTRRLDESTVTSSATPRGLSPST